MRVQVNLSDEMVERVDDYAKKMGVSRSALCSMAIGQYIFSFDKSSDFIRKLGDAFNDDVWKKLAEEKAK